MPTALEIRGRSDAVKLFQKLHDELLGWRLYAARKETRRLAGIKGRITRLVDAFLDTNGVLAEWPLEEDLPEEEAPPSGPPPEGIVTRWVEEVHDHIGPEVYKELSRFLRKQARAESQFSDYFADRFFRRPKRLFEGGGSSALEPVAEGAARPTETGPARPLEIEARDLGMYHPWPDSIIERVIDAPAHWDMRSWSGRLDYFDEGPFTSKGTVRSTLIEGLREGYGRPKMARLLKERLPEALHHKAEIVARTEVARVASMITDTQHQGLAEEGLISGYRWSAGFDQATCLVCADLDGDEFMYEHPPAEEPIPGVEPGVLTYDDLVAAREIEELSDLHDYPDDYRQRCEARRQMPVREALEDWREDPRRKAMIQAAFGEKWDDLTGEFDPARLYERKNEFCQQVASELKDEFGGRIDWRDVRKRLRGEYSKLPERRFERTPLYRKYLRPKMRRMSEEDAAALNKRIEEWTETYHRWRSDTMNAVNTLEIGSMEQRAKIPQERRDVYLFEALKKHDPRISHRFTKDPVPEDSKRGWSHVWEAIDAATPDLPERGRADTITHYYGSQGRAFHLDGEMYLFRGDARKTAVHEYGHVLERKWKTFGRSWELVEERAIGDANDPKDRETIEGLRETETWAPDDWIDQYAGKHYPHDATEVLSMGLQELYGNPGRLAILDPDLFDYTLATMEHAL